MPFPCCYVYNCSVVLQMCFFMICVMVWLKHFIFLNWWYVCSFGFVYLAFLFLVLLMFPLFIFVSPCWNMFLVAAFVLLHISSMRLCLKGSYLFCAKDRWLGTAIALSVWVPRALAHGFCVPRSAPPEFRFPRSRSNKCLQAFKNNSSSIRQHFLKHPKQIFKYSKRVLQALKTNYSSIQAKQQINYSSI